MNRREAEFAARYKEFYGVDLLPQPALFRFLVDGVIWRYSPDFYCPLTLTFFELAGTKQAASANKEKYEKFSLAYPQLKFDVVNMEGDLYFFRKRPQVLPTKPSPPKISKREFCVTVAQEMRAYQAEANLDLKQLSRLFGYTGLRKMLRTPNAVPQLVHARRLWKFLRGCGVRNIQLPNI